MGFLPVALATIVGSILGIISGYFGKAYAQIIMRTLDIFYAFPSILLAIALSSVLGSGLSSIIIPIAVILVPPIARVAESTVQDIMPEDFIEAAQTSGASPAEGYRVFHHTEHLWADLILLYHAIQRQHPVGLWLELSGIGHLFPHAGMGLHAERPAAAESTSIP